MSRHFLLALALRVGVCDNPEKIPTKSTQNSDIVVHDTDSQTGSETPKSRIKYTVLHNTDIVMTDGIND